MMDNSIIALWREGKISDETALANVTDKLIRQQISAGSGAAPAGNPVPAASPAAANYDDDDEDYYDDEDDEPKKKKWGLF